MDKLLVILGALTAIAWVNWFFFFSRRGTVAVAATSPEVVIRVQGGYEPAVIKVKRGAPVKLVFDRQEKSSCSEEVVIPDFGVRRFLPAFDKTEIEIKPEQTGTYEFTCGMGMLRGKLIVEDA